MATFLLSICYLYAAVWLHENIGLGPGREYWKKSDEN